MVKKIAIGAVALVVILAIIGALIGPEEADEASSTTTAAEVATTGAGTTQAATTEGDATTQAVTTDVATTEPATTEATTTQATTQAAPPPKKDTGRMSETEFDQFRNAHSEVVDESLQFSEGIQKCSVIGQTGDLAEFSRCADESYSGVEEDVSFARYIASETLDDVDKQCAAALRSYITVIDAYAATIAVAHKTASLLQIAAMGLAMDRLVPQSKRYSKFSTNALAACQPR